MSNSDETQQGNEIESTQPAQTNVYISHKGTCEELLGYISVNSNFELREQAGGAYIFSNGADELVVTSEIYLGKYTIWEVPNTVPDA